MQEQLTARGQTLVTQARALRITDAASYAEAGRAARALKQFIADVSEWTDPVVRSAHNTWKAALKLRGDLRDPAEAVQESIRKALAAYEDEQQRLRDEQAAAARREQERLEAEERQRVAAEEQRLRDEAEARRAQQAADAQATGDHTLAARIAAQPVDVPLVEHRPVFVAPVPEPVKLDGVGFRELWTAQVTSLQELVMAVAEGRQSLNVLQPNQEALNKMAEALHEHLNVPGVAPVRTRVPVIKA